MSVRLPAPGRGTILKSARCEAFRTEEGRRKAHQALLENDVDALVVIGGNGTFTGAMLLSRETGFPIIGLPGTIDNDLSGTDFTIGFDTATNTVVEAVDKIRDTADSHNRLFFVEVMGRDSGFIALNAGIATGAVAVMTPESGLSIQDLVDILNLGQASNKTSVLSLLQKATPKEEPSKLRRRFMQSTTSMKHESRCWGTCNAEAMQLCRSRIGVSYGCGCR